MMDLMYSNRYVQCKTFGPLVTYVLLSYLCIICVIQTGGSSRFELEQHWDKIHKKNIIWVKKVFGLLTC